MSRPHVLVVGAGVAGLALAAELSGHVEITVVEHDHALRCGGQTVDLRGPSRTVVDRLGLTDALLARTVPQSGYAVVDAGDRALVRHPVELFAGHGIVSDTEVGRGDLVALLAGAAAGARFRFGTTVRALVPDPHGVEVEFSDGSRDRFDLVVGADGLNSTVRRLAFGPDARFRTPLGVSIAWFSAEGPFDGPVTPGSWYRAHHVPGLRVALRPTRTPGTFCTEFAVRHRPAEAPRRDRAALLDDLDRRFEGVGWHAPALLRAARTATDLAGQEIATIRVPRWSVDRVVLLGDAAWCPSPLTGTGTAMALVGAHVLAGRLREHPVQHWDDTALPAYRDRLADWVARCAQLPPGGVSSFVPGSRAALALGRVAMTWMARPPFRALAARTFSRPDDLELAEVAVPR